MASKRGPESEGSYRDRFSFLRGHPKTQRVACEGEHIPPLAVDKLGLSGEEKEILLRRELNP